MKRTVQDFIVSGFGAITSILTAIVLFLIEQSIGLSIYTWTVWFIIPAGAICAGFVAAGGYYLGAKFFNHRTSWLILFNMVAISVATFVLVHYLTYAFMEVDGRPVHEFVPFESYMDIRLRHTSVEFRYRGAAKLGTTGELGEAGYLYALLQIVGFAIGGVAVYRWLASEPYCQTCSQYLSKRDKQSRFSGDADQFSEMVKIFLAHIALDQFQEAIKKHASFGERRSRKGLHLQSALELRQCNRCGINWLNFSCYKWAGRDWQEIHELHYSTFYKADAKEKVFSNNGES